jgi:hypothetical protein
MQKLFQFCSLEKPIRKRQGNEWREFKNAKSNSFALHSLAFESLFLLSASTASRDS